VTAPVIDTALAAFAAVLVLGVFGSLLFVEWAARGDTDGGTQ
jgi:hypothetical protein